MIRITLMSGKYYGRKIDLNDQDDIDDIDTFANEGTPCIIVADIDDLDELGIEPSNVVMVD